MPNYLLVNLDTGNQLAGYSHGHDLFAKMVETANKWSNRLGQRIAVMGQPFFDESIHGKDFTSELYVAQPQGPNHD